MADNEARPGKLTAHQVALWRAWAATCGGYGPAHAGTLAEVRQATGQRFRLRATLVILEQLGYLVRMPGEETAHSLVRTRFYAVDRAYRDGTR